MDLYADPGEVEGGDTEEEPYEGYDDDQGDGEPIQDVCPECGQDAEVNADGNCMNCISEQVMKFAVDNAKQAHKDGKDIGSLAPDLKAVKMARQEKDYDEVIAISERIIANLEDILGEDLQEELDNRKAGKRRKKKKKKVMK